MVSIFFFYYGFYTKIFYQEFIFSNPGQKLLYSGSTSVTSMHEKKKKKKENSIHTKKARCKIFTNSYKNINMNKLISSTFLYCPAFLPPCFPTNGKETCQRRRSPFTGRCVSFTTLIKKPNPAPMSCKHPRRQRGWNTLFYNFHKCNSRQSGSNLEKQIKWRLNFCHLFQSSQTSATVVWQQASVCCLW